MMLEKVGANCNWKPVLDLTTTKNTPVADIEYYCFNG